MLEEVGREAHPRCLEEGHHTSICFRGASALHFPTLLPCVHCGGVSERLHLQTSQWPLRQTLSALQTPQSPYGTLLQQLVSGLLRRMPAFQQPCL